MRRKVRLTESDLHRIVKRSVKKVLNEISDDTLHRAAQKAVDNWGYFSDYAKVPLKDLVHGRRKREQAWNLIDHAQDRMRTNDYEYDMNNKYVKKLFDFYDSLEWELGGTDFDNPHDVSDIGRFASEKLGIAHPICTEVFYDYLEQHPEIRGYDNEDDEEY